MYLGRALWRLLATWATLLLSCQRRTLDLHCAALTSARAKWCTFLTWTHSSFNSFELLCFSNLTQLNLPLGLYCLYSFSFNFSIFLIPLFFLNLLLHSFSRSFLFLSLYSHAVQLVHKLICLRWAFLVVLLLGAIHYQGIHISIKCRFLLNVGYLGRRCFNWFDFLRNLLGRLIIGFHFWLLNVFWELRLNQLTLLTFVFLFFLFKNLCCSFLLLSQ